MLYLNHKEKQKPTGQEEIKMMKMIQKEEFIETVKKELQEKGDQMRVYLNGSIVNGYYFDNPKTNNELVVAKKSDELDDIEEFYAEYQSELKKLHIKFTDVIDPLSIMAYDSANNDYDYISKNQAEDMEFVKDMISKGWLVAEKGIITEY